MPSTKKPHRTLVTGGAGFIGSHLVEALLRRHHEVLVIDNLSTGHEKNLASASEQGAKLAKGDITDAAFVEREIANFKPNTVFHLAAQADVRRAVADPAYDAQINVVGTANVLEAARRSGAGGFVLATTGGNIYGEGEGNEGLPFNENAPALPHTPYGTSKLGAESYVALYRRLHGMAGVSLRLGNIYGPRQDPHGEAGVVAIFCGRLLEGVPPTIFGDGSQTRDYVYVDDAVEAFLAAHDLLTAGGPIGAGIFNIGTGRETSILELLEILAVGAEKSADHELAPHRFGDIQRFVIDPSLAAKGLGWRAQVQFEDGLGRTFSELASRRSQQAGVVPRSEQLA